jgi:hypothetical protein
MISLNREDIRRMIVSEMISVRSLKKLPDEFYGALENTIYNSHFWTYENGEDDIELNKIGGEYWEQTDAAVTLGDTIQGFFDVAGFPITIVVRTPDPIVNTEWIVNPGHKDYPDRIVLGGEQSLSNRGRFVMYLNLVIFGPDFIINDIDPVVVSKDIGRIIRHELTHALHYEKRRSSQGISRLTAKQRFEDEGEIVDSKDREKYLSSKIEIDAYAHQFAEELLSNYGKEEAIQFLRGPVEKFKNADVSDELIEYLFYFSDPLLIKRLKSKIYANIIDLTDREIYEAKKKKKRKNYSGSQPEDAYMKGTKKNLHLDKPSSHGGWPSGPSKSFTSNKPVMKQISSWLEDMAMLEELEEEFEDI